MSTIKGSPIVSSFKMNRREANAGGERPFLGETFADIADIVHRNYSTHHVNL
jgi:hypothetical protein